MWDKERKEWKRVGIAYTPVHDPEINEKQLYLVIVRDKKKGRPPIYFLTDVKIDTNGTRRLSEANGLICPQILHETMGCRTSFPLWKKCYGDTIS